MLKLLTTSYPTGIASQSNTVANQPTSCAWAEKAAIERIQNIRETHTTDVPQYQVIIAVENCLVELCPERWFDIGCLYLDDPLTSCKLVTFTQATSVPNEAVNRLKFETPADYEKLESGFKMTIGQVMSERLNCSHDRWHEEFVGVSRSSIIYLAACSLAKQFKDRITKKPLTQPREQV